MTTAYAECGMVACLGAKETYDQLRRMRSGVRALSLADEARTAILLPHLSRSIETPRVNPALRHVRLRVLPTIRRAGRGRAGSPVLLPGLLRRLAGAEPKGEHIPQGRRSARAQNRRGGRTRTTTVARRSCAPQGPEQASQRPKQPSRVPVSVGPRSLSRRGYVR